MAYQRDNVMKHNFGAGPCILPPSVMEKASAAVLNWENSGLSILEISHRTPEFLEVVKITEGLVRELLNVPEDYSVLFLQGGASSQFSMIPLNLMGEKTRAAYLDSGLFAQKAITECRHFGEPVVVASSGSANYNFIPRQWAVPQECAYLHITSNNTIEGTEMGFAPKVPVPLVCDMSSNIFSREMDISEYDLIYAGAQKNMGPAGMTMVILKKALMEQVDFSIPAMWDYRTYRDSNSLYNTPAVFSIYVTMLNLQWLKEQGGISEIEKRNIQKAALLYREIDDNPLFYGFSVPQDRSRMNITFRMFDETLEDDFFQFATDRGMVGIKGYVTTGGFRVSMYNALPLTSVRALVGCMQEYSMEKERETAGSLEKIFEQIG